MASSLDSSLDFTRYLRMLWRRKGIILLCAVSVCCTTLITLTLIPKEYRSEATLMIEERKPMAQELEQVMGGIRTQTAGYGAEEQRLGKLMGRVRSRPFLERVIRLLRMNEDPSVRAEAEKRHKQHPEISVDEMAVRILVQAIQSRLQFGSVGPGIYKISVVDYSPDNAQLLAKWISELFVDVTTQKELEQIRAARDFGAEQLRVYEEQLRRSEEALERYKGSVIEQGLTQSVVRSENIVVAEALYRRLLDESARAQARVKPFARAVTEAGMPLEDTALREDPEVQDLSKRAAAALRSAINDRLAVTTGELGPWPPQGAYAELRRDLFQHLEAREVALHPQAGAEAAGAIARYAFAQLDGDIQANATHFLEQALEDCRRRAQSQPVDEMELTRLENDLRKNRQLLDSFRAQMVASDVSQAVESTSLGLRIEILDPAQLPLTPSRPDKVRILTAALLIGPLVGAGIAFLSETADSTLRSLDDFQRVVQEPILATTPLLTNLVPRPRGIRRYWKRTVLASVVLLTAGYFVARQTVLRDFSISGKPVQAVKPENVVAP